MKQAVIDAIKHKNGKLPYNVELTSEKRRDLCAQIGIDEKDYFSWAGNHIEKADYNFGEYISEGFFKDNFGVIWNRTGLDKDIGVVDNLLINDDNYDDYICPNIDYTHINDVTLSLVNSKPDTLRLGKISMTLFERAWSLRGMQELLMDFIVEPESVEGLLNKITQYNMNIINIALEHDIDGFYFGDDFGTQKSLIMNPDTWRKYIKPHYKTMFEKIKKHGKITALHSCGNIYDILGDLIDIGLDIYQTVQPEIYDLKFLKNEYGNDLCFWGAISTQRLLPFASKTELTDVVNQTIDIMGKNGGYIASPTHQVPPDVKSENILTLIELLKNY
ncbi:MAG: uroporphyrinogen decarboxylase [Oscillospiraceae bacterium]|jgi:uroporphyrinogen decarboxylase|nr:uroporphyrinogen decarboxylase [Oscillospiraceae bacterium]